MARMRGHPSFGATAVVVLVYAGAMAYLEAAVVVYRQLALGGQVGVLFPLPPAGETGDLLAIEVGREAATLVMIAAVGLLVGRTWLERLAWSAVVFGTWDIGYYAWLHVFSGWQFPATPPSAEPYYTVNVYQEGARRYGEPKFYPCPQTGCREP